MAWQLVAYLGVGEDRWRDDLLGSKGLSRVDERGEDLAALFAFGCGRRKVSAICRSRDCAIIFESRDARDASTHRISSKGADC